MVVSAGPVRTGARSETTAETPPPAREGMGVFVSISMNGRAALRVATYVRARPAPKRATTTVALATPTHARTCRERRQRRSANGLAGDGAEPASVSSHLAGIGSDGTMAGVPCERRASPRLLPHILQKWACRRLIAWQPGHCICSVAP